MKAEPLRVVHLIDSLRLGGAERLVVTTVRHLDRKRFRPAVVTLFLPLDLQDDLERLGVPVHHLGLRSQLDWQRGILGLAGFLRQYQCDILHTHLLFANVYGRIAALLARTPAVVTSLHSLDYTHFASSGWRGKFAKLVDRVTGTLRTREFIAVSKAVHEDYSRHFQLNGGGVIYNYLDPGDFTPLAPEAREAKRREFHWTANEFVILNVASLAPRKGQRHLLLALPEIRQAIPSTRLLLVGDGPAKISYQQLSRALGIDTPVVFAGPRRDVPALLGIADLFVFPSLGEGLGIALLEAMAAGLPIVASRVDGITEVVEDGVNGLLVRPADPGGIAEAVIRAHADPGLRRALGRAARHTVERRFSVSVGIPQLESVYLRVHGRRPATW